MKIVQELTRNHLCCRVASMNKGERSFHWHENYEICRIINQNCSFLIDGVLVKACPGDIITISEQTVHNFLVEYDNTLINIAQFHPAELLSLTDKIQPLRIHIPSSEIKQIPHLEEKLISLFDMMTQETNAPTAKDNKFLQAIVASLYFLLSRHFADKHENANRSQRNDFYSITEYINAHFTEDISVNSISSHFYFSRGKLTAIFKKYAGMGITEYISKLRINNANLLMSGGTSITQAAISSGFESIRTFNNTYKKVMGITPSEYLKSTKPTA